MKSLSNFINESVNESTSYTIDSMIANNFKYFEDPRTGKKYNVHKDHKSFVEELKKLKLRFLSDDTRGLVVYGRRPFVKDWTQAVGISFSDLGGKPTVSFNTYNDSVPKQSMTVKDALDFIKKAINNQSFYMLEGVNKKIRYCIRY